jgi:tRNA-dihydrouridine synthase
MLRDFCRPLRMCCIMRSWPITLFIFWTHPSCLLAQPQEHADYVDLNLGCPQRIARRGKYGAFLMDDPKIAAAIVAAAARGLDVPVSVKIRLYPSLSDTIAYAQMLQAAGASLIAVHGRTRDMKVRALQHDRCHALH